MNSNPNIVKKNQNKVTGPPLLHASNPTYSWGRLGTLNLACSPGNISRHHISKIPHTGNVN
jgi:hypothetical protein